MALDLLDAMSDALVLAALVGGMFAGVAAEVVETEPEDWEDFE